MKLQDVRPMHVRELLAAWRAAGMAPRSVANLYGSLHRLFADAVADEVLDISPVVVPAGEMPKREDKDPAWRATAVFTRAEVEALISSGVVDLDRRVLYALGALAGLREGEVSALRWSHYEPDFEPLGRLLVVGSYSRTHKRVKTTKTRRARTVPVHPTLAKLLAEWKLSGWQAQHGRKPKPGDLLLPSRSVETMQKPLTHLTDLSVGDAIKRDLVKLGFAHRRFHDLRRTFISLAIADGARGDVLRWVTHGPSGSVMDLYTTLPWAPLCEAVKALRVRLRGRGTTVFTTVTGA